MLGSTRTSGCIATLHFSFALRPDVASVAEGLNRFGFTAAILKWLEFTEERAVLVIARDGFILWSRSSEPALKSGAYFRTRNVTCPVPEMSVASGRWGDTRCREAVVIPPGVWFPQDAVVETTIFSDRFDMTISLLQLERCPQAGSVDVEPEEDLLDQIVLITLTAICLSIGSIFALLNETERPDTLRLTLAIASVPLGWLTLHTIAAFHYAHLYYALLREGDVGSRTSARCGRLRIP